MPGTEWRCNHGKCHCFLTIFPLFLCKASLCSSNKLASSLQRGLRAKLSISAYIMPQHWGCWGSSPSQSSEPKRKGKRIFSPPAVDIHWFGWSSLVTTLQFSFWGTPLPMWMDSPALTCPGMNMWPKQSQVTPNATKCRGLCPKKHSLYYNWRLQRSPCGEKLPLKEAQERETTKQVRALEFSITFAIKFLLMLSLKIFIVILRHFERASCHLQLKESE